MKSLFAPLGVEVSAVCLEPILSSLGDEVLMLRCVVEFGVVGGVGILRTTSIVEHGRLGY